MIRCGSTIAFWLSVCAIPLHAGCSRGDKERVCREYMEVLGEHHASSDLREYTEPLRKAAKVLEGLRGVPEADAHRHDLEALADAIDGMYSKGGSPSGAYQEAARAMKTSSGPFLEFCQG